MNGALFFPPNPYVLYEAPRFGTLPPIDIAIPGESAFPLFIPIFEFEDGFLDGSSDLPPAVFLFPLPQTLPGAGVFSLRGTKSFFSLFSSRSRLPEFPFLAVF